MTWLDRVTPILRRRWDPLIAYGLGGPAPGDTTKLVEPWGRRMTRSLALKLGAFGLVREFEARFWLAHWAQRRRLWITAVDNQGKTAPAVCTLARVQVDAESGRSL